MTSTIEAMKQALKLINKAIRQELPATVAVVDLHIAAGKLAEAIASEEAQSVEPVGVVIQKMGFPEGSCFVRWNVLPVAGSLIYTHPSPDLAAAIKQALALLTDGPDNNVREAIEVLKKAGVK